MATTQSPISPPPAAATERELLARVKPDPHRRGPDRWRVVDGDIAVWAIIQDLIASGGLDDPLLATDAQIHYTAEGFRIPERGVRAALAYYRAHRCAIDTRLAINDAVAGGEDVPASILRSPDTEQPGSNTDLLARVKPDPNRPGPDRWRVIDGDIAVWAIIQDMIASGNLDDPLLATDAQIRYTAEGFRIPEIGVRAALAYYRAHRCAIDTRLAINDAVASG